jgi:hypothetical protein
MWKKFREKPDLLRRMDPEKARIEKKQRLLRMKRTETLQE